MSVGCGRILGGAGDPGSQVTTAIAFRTRSLPGAYRNFNAFTADLVRVVIKAAPGSPAGRTAINDFFYAFYAHDPVRNAPGALLAAPAPVFSSGSSTLSSTFQWYGIDVSRVSAGLTLLPNTTYWFSLLPPAARVTLPASLTSANGILFGGVYDPTNSLALNVASDRTLFTTAELGSESRANDPNFNCGVVGASTFLRDMSIWGLAPLASSRLRFPPANPTGLGPLRMGIDVQGYNVKRTIVG